MDRYPLAIWISNWILQRNVVEVYEWDFAVRKLWKWYWKKLLNDDNDNNDDMNNNDFTKKFYNLHRPQKVYEHFFSF